MDFVIPNTAGGHQYLSLSVDCFVARLCQWPCAGEAADGHVAAHGRPQQISRYLFYPVLSQAIGSPFSHAHDTSLKERTSCSFFGIGGFWLEQKRKGKGYLLPQF